MAQQTSTRPPPMLAWSFLAVVALGVAGTIAVHLARLPTGARGYYNRGVADSRAGRFEAAIANLERALAIDPTRVDARIALANTWNRSGRPYRGLTEAVAALELAPTSSRAFYVRGLSLREIGREDDALASFDLAVAADPSFGRAALAQGDALFDAGRYAEALSSYRRAHAVRRSDATLYSTPMLVWASRSMAGDPAGADAELRELASGSLADRLRFAAPDADPAVSSWIDAIKALAAGDTARAIERLRAAVALAPPGSWVRDRARSTLRTLVLGLLVQPDNSEISASISFGPGVTIACVREGGAADRAGVAVGDRLLRVDGDEATLELIGSLVARAVVGAELRFELTRQGRPLEATVAVGAWSGVRPGSSAPTR